MRVLFVMSQFIPHIGGTEINLARFMATLRQHGHTVELVTIRKRSAWAVQTVIDGVPVTRVRGVYRRGSLRLGYGLAAVLYLNAARVLRQHIHRADLVYCAGMNPLSGIAAALAQRAGKPVVIRVATTGPLPGAPGSDETRDEQLVAGPLDPALPVLRVAARTWVGSDIDHLTSTYPWLKGPLLRVFRQPGVHFIALTSMMKERLAQAGIASDRITIIPNGLDTATFTAPRIADPARPPTAIVVARHSFEKGVDVALHAWRLVRARLPDARLVLCGDGPLRGQFEQIAAQLGIADRVEFRGSVKDVAAALAAADCFILPSRWEGFPVSLLEAAVAGLPAVATQVSGVSDLLISGETGFSVPVADYAAMADALVVILSDRDRARRMGAAAANHTQAMFSQVNAIDRFTDLAARLSAQAYQPPPEATR